MNDRGKIHEILRYTDENQVHRIIGGIFPATNQGTFVGIPGTVVASMCYREPENSRVFCSNVPGHK